MATDITASAIAIEAAIERLRQERETFDQLKTQEARWFTLRLTMGYAAAIMLPAIAVLCAYIMLHPQLYSSATVGTATGALLTDVLGLLATVWKVVFNQSSMPKLSPVTSAKVSTNVTKPQLPKPSK